MLKGFFQTAKLELPSFQVDCMAKVSFLDSKNLEIA